MLSKKSVTYVSPNSKYSSAAAQVSSELDLQFNRLSDITELFPLLSDHKFNTNLILIDIEGFYKISGASVFDVIRTLSTLIKCTVHRSKPGKPTRREIYLGAAVDSNTDPKLIREILGIIDIKGLYPCDAGISSDSKKQAIVDLVQGKCHIPAKINELLKSKKRTVRVIRGDNIVLTPRQAQILDLIATRGASNKVIAKILDISESTVKLHVSAIFKKYGVRNRTQLAVFTKEK